MCGTRRTPAWPAARSALADSLRQQSVKWLAANRDEIRGEGGIIEPRALPYRMTVVMIEPTVIVMNFDLGAMIHEGEPQLGQIVGAAYIDGVVIYGTRVPATGSLLWFSPEAKAPPAPVANQRAGRGEIQVGGVTLSLERGADLWTVTRR